MLGAQQVEQLPPGLVLRHDAVLDVRAVKARHEVAGSLQVQPGRDLSMGRLGGRRGERDTGYRGPALVQCGQGEVVGPEVVPPLGHAVRLVDGEKRDLATVEQSQRRLRPQAFRRQVEQVKLPREERRLDQPALAGVLRGIEDARPHAEDGQGVDLILHERDERRDDDARSGAHERGNLVAQRLAATGRHEHERVAAGDDVIDDLPLAVTERLVAEDAPQHARRLADLGADVGGSHRARILTAAADAATADVPPARGPGGSRGITPRGNAARPPRRRPGSQREDTSTVASAGTFALSCVQMNQPSPNRASAEAT